MPPPYRRLNQILQKLTPAQWSDYEKRVRGKTSNLDDFEASVDAYLKAQQQREAEAAERERLVEKFSGLEDVYKKYGRLKAMMLARAINPAAAAIGELIGGETAEDVAKSLTVDLKKFGFAGGIPEFQKYINDYTAAFQKETVKIGLDILENGLRRFILFLPFLFFLGCIR